MLDALITSQVRIQILTRLFLTAGSRTYLRELVKTFDASPGHMRAELAQLSTAGLIVREKNGRQVDYLANVDHPLYPELQSMVRKSLGIDRLLDAVRDRAERVEAVYLAGERVLAKGADTLDLVFVGDVDLERFRGCVHTPLFGHRRRVRMRVLPGSAAAPADVLEAIGPGLV